MSIVFLGLLHLINIKSGIWNWSLTAIWLVFLIDYLTRLLVAKSKKDFLIQNLFDLLALVPSHPIFVFFRSARIVAVLREYHVFWKLGWSGTWSRKIHTFFYDTGFIYLFSFSLVILIFASLLFSFFEHHSLAQSLWWSVVTSTTVGYGDVTPKSAGGKIVAAVLMFGGIGFIGLLTSTITDYFTQTAQDDTEDEQTKALKELTQQVNQLTRKVNALQRELHQSKKTTKTKSSNKS